MTKAQLLEENRQLQERVAKLESAYPSLAETEKIRLDLRERMKELECLYTLSGLREKHFPSADGFLQELAEFLPNSFLVPEQACARIRWGDRHYLSDPFQESPLRIGSEIRVDGRKVGVVEVYYRKLELLPADGPFLPEEYKLIEAVSDHVARTLEQMQRDADLVAANQALKCEHQALHETNSALRTVMNRLEHEKRDIRASIVNNIQKIIMPIVYELELQVGGKDRAYVSLLRQNLSQIADPFLSEICHNRPNMSPVEIVISTMIRNGLSTKEIARIRGISSATVRRHRENIRQKLGLRNRKVNLTTYLQSVYMPDDSIPDQPVPGSP